MINRLINRKIFDNNYKLYGDYLEERGLNKIQQYNSGFIKYPSELQLKKIAYKEHIWVTGDRLYKLSNLYFGDPKNWWIILVFNKIGSEVNIKQGDIIRIPVDLQDILFLFL